MLTYIINPHKKLTVYCYIILYCLLIEATTNNPHKVGEPQ